MIRTVTRAVAAAGLLLSASAAAQEGGTEGLTEEEVREFFDVMVRQTEQAADAEDWKGATEWMQRHIAEGASFAIEGVVMAADGPVFTYATTLDSGDIARFTAAATNGPLSAVMRAVEDYSVAMDVKQVDLLPTGEASAAVEFRETALVDLARLHEPPTGEAEQETQAERPAPVAVQSSGRCEFRLVEGGEETVTISVAACRATTTL